MTYHRETACVHLYMNPDENQNFRPNIYIDGEIRDLKAMLVTASRMRVERVPTELLRSSFEKKESNNSQQRAIKHDMKSWAVLLFVDWAVSESEILYVVQHIPKNKRSKCCTDGK